MSTTFKPTSVEAAAPTTLITATSLGRFVRAFNNAGASTVNTVSIAKYLTVSTAVNNAALQADITVENASALQIGDTVVHPNITGGNADITNIVGNVVTLDANLASAIDGSGTPVELEVYRLTGRASINGHESVYIRMNEDERIFASAATVLLCSTIAPGT